MFAEGDNMFRIGQSIDIHQLVEGRDLYIGGVKIDHDKGLLGHSDADVLLHAIIESIIGAFLNIKEFLQWFYWNIVIN